MPRFILQRMLSMILVVLIVASGTFFMMRLLPSGPFAREKKLPAEIIKNLEARYHLDDPLWKQYVDYMKNLLRGDLGPSFKYKDRTVNNIINDGFPVSAALGVVAGLEVLDDLSRQLLFAGEGSRWKQAHHEKGSRCDNEDNKNHREHALQNKLEHRASIDKTGGGPPASRAEPPRFFSCLDRVCRRQEVPDSYDM